MRAFYSVALLFLAAPAGAQTDTTEAEGVAAIVNNDIAQARDKAVDDAKRKAVEQVAGAQVSSESISKNFELVEDKILSRASGFIRNYQIVSEYKEEGAYHVKIRATVDKSAVANDLSLILKEKPRVMVMIAEQNIGSKGFSYWWGSSGFVSDMDIMQNSLIEAWQPKGFKFIDPGLLNDKLTVKGAMRNPGLADEHAVSLSRDADADIVIIGKVLVSDAGPVMEGVKMHSFHAVGSLRILNVDTGEVVAVADDTGVAPHIDPNVGGRQAIKALAKKLAGTLEGKILAKWTAEAASARDLELVVQNVKSASQASALERLIREEIRGVESVSLRKKQKTVAHYSVRIRATANELGTDLEAKTVDGQKLDVVSTSGAKLVLSLQ